MPSRNVISIIVAVVLSAICFQRASHSRYAGAIAEAMGQIDANFVEEVDRRDLFEGSMRGMLRNLDPYSGFISTTEYEELLEDLDQQFGGIGIYVDLDPDSQRLMVLSPLFGTPAYEAGIRAGDLILEIDGESTDGLTSNDMVGIIRGKPGTDVKLTILPYGTESTREITLTRAIIPVESVLGDSRREDGSWEFTLADHPEIGYIRVVSFGENTARELATAIQSIPTPEALILDLRGNPGGLLEAAVDVCDLFIDNQLVVSIRGRDGYSQHDFFAHDGSIIPDSLPMVVLIDRYSASASEIVAACLQDQGRATVVGERSWGKGTVQSVIELEGGRSAMRLTTATYWRPSGKNIHRTKRAQEQDEWGVTPDPGLLLKLEPAEYTSLLRARRERDALVNRSGSHPKGDQTSDATLPIGDQVPSQNATDDGPSADRQLELAIEHLKRDQAKVAA